MNISKSHNTIKLETEDHDITISAKDIFGVTVYVVTIDGEPTFFDSLAAGLSKVVTKLDYQDRREFNDWLR